MKIGILTLTLHTNYGGILQAYALQTVLERMGHEVEVLNRPFTPQKTKWMQIPKRIVKKMLGRDVVIFSERRYNREAPVINKAIWDFRKKYIHERFVNSLHDIKEDDYDCIVVGSDQVWRPKYFKEQWKTGIEDAYLAFTKGWKIKRIAYAASFGVDTWEYTEEETAKCKEAISLFDNVSVREKTSIYLCEEFFHTNVRWMIDPTLHLCSQDYISILGEQRAGSSKYLLTYILDSTPVKEQLANSVAKQKGIKRVDLKRVTNNLSPMNEKILCSVESWLEGFRDADFVVTDSFHGCVFSIIFNKPFVVMTNIERGACRISSLLEMFHLENNLIANYDGFNPNASYIPNVKEIFSEWRSGSMEYLNKTIRKNE